MLLSAVTWVATPSLQPVSSRPIAVAGEAAPGSSVTIESPSGDVRIAFGLYEAAGQTGVAAYDVLWRDRILLQRARVLIALAGMAPLDAGFRIVSVTRRQYDETYRVFPGKSSAARNRCREAVIALEEHASPHRRLDLIFRAYDDGAAFRYRFPQQPGLAEIAITEERSLFTFVGNPNAYTLPLGGFTTSYEQYYRAGPLHDVAPDILLGLPLLLAFPNDIWMAVTEANLTDYAGMYLSGVADHPGTFVSRLSPLPGDSHVAVKVGTPHASPWRVLMIGDRPGALVESNLILNLSDPNAIGDTSWIKPGKTTFPWWNGYEVGDAGFRGGLNTQTMKHYIDFCAEQGIAYHSLDGFDRAWYGGPIVPYEGADITKSVAEIDLPEVLAYARRKGVGLRLWLHWQAAKAHMATAFPIYEKWGIEGVMLDFMDRDDQEMINFLHEAVRLAAEHHLTVSLHGASKPTGLRRTYPNLLTTEAVLNLEYNKWETHGVPPEHEVTVPFIRMLAGPLDFHQGSFRHVWPRDFEARTVAPVVKGTRARTLASYVVFENYLPMVADYPAAYRNQPGLEFLRQVPATWDETRVLNGAPGQFITIARRRGNEWYVGSMAGTDPRRLAIQLDFLGGGPYEAELYEDDPDASRPPASINRRRMQVTAADTLQADMVGAGGYAVRLVPVQ